MNALQDLQNHFQNYLFHGDVNFQSLITSTHKVSTQTRLEIYSNAYQSRLVEALSTNYPVLKNYTGDEFFVEMALAYIRQYPSCHYSIRWFGDQLASFLSHYLPVQASPFLTELAQFEWLQTLVFDARDQPILCIEYMASIPPDSWADMRFDFHSSVYRINFLWNIIEIVQAFLEEHIPLPSPQKSDLTHWIVWRRDLINRFISLPRDETWAIDFLITGKTFGEMCEGLCRWHNEEEIGVYAASLLKKWIDSGWIAAVQL